MSTENKTAHPLCWPMARPRTAANERRQNNNFQTKFAPARDACAEEIRLLKGENAIISTNIPLKANGMPYAVDFGDNVSDPGVAVYFTRKGKKMCFACDRWNNLHDNMHAITLTINALRGISRWGTGNMMEAAFTGFAALPQQASGIDPCKVLGLENISMERLTEDEITAAFRFKSKVYHPDIPGTGDAAKWRELREAHDLLMQNVRK